MKEKEKENKIEEIICSRCGKPIDNKNGEEWMEFNGQKYHLECFGNSCPNCG